MRSGFAFSNYTWSADQGLLEDTFRLIIERAERAGFFSLWLPDHFFQVGAPAGSTENEMLERRGAPVRRYVTRNNMHMALATI